LPTNQLEKIEQLSKENEQIKAELASLRQLLVAATVKYGKPLKVAAINE
jgi:ribosomal protein L29